jgi:hypothetical protein
VADDHSGWSAASADGGDFDPHARYYAQGVVNLVPSTADTGGNVVVAGSHRHYPSLNKQGITAEIVAARPEVFIGNIIIAHVEAGDAILWDDRAIHCNHPGVTGTVPAGDSLLRVACYCTMAPAATAVAEVLEIRKACVEQGWVSGSGGWCAHRVITPSRRGAGAQDHAHEVVAADGFKVAPQAVLGPVELSLVVGSR